MSVSAAEQREGDATKKWSMSLNRLDPPPRQSRYIASENQTQTMLDSYLLYSPPWRTKVRYWNRLINLGHKEEAKNLINTPRLDSSITRRYAEIETRTEREEGFVERPHQMENRLPKVAGVNQAYSLHQMENRLPKVAGVNQAYSLLSTIHGHITDCNLDSVVYAGICVEI